MNFSLISIFSKKTQLYHAFIGLNIPEADVGLMKEIDHVLDVGHLIRRWSQQPFFLNL